MGWGSGRERQTETHTETEAERQRERERGGKSRWERDAARETQRRSEGPIRVPAQGGACRTRAPALSSMPVRVKTCSAESKQPLQQQEGRAAAGWRCGQCVEHPFMGLREADWEGPGCSGAGQETGSRCPGPVGAGSQPRLLNLLHPLQVPPRPQARPGCSPPPVAWPCQSLPLPYCPPGLRQRATDVSLSRVLFQSKGQLKQFCNLGSPSQGTILNAARRRSRPSGAPGVADTAAQLPPWGGRDTWGGSALCCAFPGHHPHGDGAQEEGLSPPGERRQEPRHPGADTGGPSRGSGRAASGKPADSRGLGG